MTEDEKAAAQAAADAKKAQEDADAAAAAAKKGDEKPADKTFSEAYVKRLREEAAAAKTKADELRAAIDARETADLEAQKEFKKIADKEKARADKAEAERDQVKASVNKRLAEIELRATAREAGIVDVDDVKLIDASTISVDDDGNVIGAKEAVDKFKTEKPHKFKDAKTADEGKPVTKVADRTAAPNSKAKPEVKDAKDMTTEEFNKAWATAGTV